ncbi:hypothetical protein DYU11_26980 [Fibrisoma montanum]|uniref:Antibiotic biosynthesis monooxygenase n=1 Tax=Fibrisoma montanum TaxID=2305895 RepID=A0A418LZG3_9BACT|nr:hypothetical protein [Fibrisoma montanum]RIV18624.1 hypothetical protein DYU11_26980 [Fibrisoma montanum]
MSKQSIVRVHAQASVNPNDWETFKQMVAETKIIVEKEGPESVLLHECYYDPATFECLIIEAYANEAAFLGHLELIKPLSAKYKVDWKIDHLTLLGPYSDNVVAAMRASSEPAFSHYPASLAH